MCACWPNDDDYNNDGDDDDRPTDGNDIVNDIVVAVHRVTVQWAFVEVQWRIFRLMQPNEKADRAANHS